MEKRLWPVVVMLTLTVSTGSFAAFVIQEKQKPRKVTRVKRPVFTQRDWDGIYFEDIFSDGLVGERPTPTSPTTPKIVENNSSTNEPESNSSKPGSWSSLISGETLENETKKLQQQLQVDVTTPSKFKSGYNKARYTYAVLSMVFGIIREYDGDVRWKNYAPVAQAAFARSSTVAREGSQQAFQNAKNRRDQLVEMVRGGTFEATEKAPDELDWSEVVDRSPLMQRLQTSFDTIKPHLASKKDFDANVEVVLHEANMIAAMGKVLSFEEMENGDDDEYLGYAKAMTTAAVQIAQASKTQNYDLASPAFNDIGASCVDCHGEFR